MVLLADLGEELEARAAVAVAVLHADLGEDARHGLGADPAVERRDRAEAALRASRCCRPTRDSRRPAGRRRRASRRRRPGPCRTSPALIAMHGHAQRRGAGGAGVRHVVDGDAGLAELLLEQLADAAPGPSGCRRRSRRCPSWSRRRRPARPCTASAARSTVSLSGCLPNLVMWIPRIQSSSDADVIVVNLPGVRSRSRPLRCRCRPCRSTSVVRRTFMPVLTCSGSGVTLIRLARTLVPSQSTTAATNGHRDPGRGERHDGEGRAPHRSSALDTVSNSVASAGGAGVATVEEAGAARGALVGHQVRVVPQHQVVDQRDLLRHHAPRLGSEDHLPNVVRARKSIGQSVHSSRSDH